MTDPTAPTTDAWKGHALGGPDALFCVKDYEAPNADQDPQAWFASHLEADGCPDYVVEFERTWRGMVADGRGGLDVDKVARELADYGALMERVSIVYDDVTGSRISKPTTAAHAVISATEDAAAMTYAANLCDVIDRLGEPIEPAELIEVANEWSPGAWIEHEANRDRLAAIRSGVTS